MAGHVRQRAFTTKRGTKLVRWRARHPNPMGTGTAQVEKSFKTRAEAYAWLDEQRHAVRTGTYIARSDSDTLFAAIAEEYRTTWTDLAPQTKAGYDHILRKHLEPKFGNAKVSAISPDAVQKFINKLAEKRKPNTVRRIYGVLRGALDMAVRRRYIPTNPCDAVRLPRQSAVPAERMLILTPAEIRAVAEAIDPHWRVPVYVAAYCGLRAGELWALRRCDVDVLNGEIHVRQALKEINGADHSILQDDERGLVFGPPKSEASRRKLAIPGPLKVMLQEHLASPLPGGDGGNALIFTTPSGLPVRHGLFYRRVFKPALRQTLPSDMHGLRWHDLRHTCASLSLSISPNLHVVKQRLGHTDIRTTVNTYGHMVASVDQALADGLGALFDAAAVPPRRDVVALRLKLQAADASVLTSRATTVS